MSADTSKRVRVTPVDGIVVQGTAPELARQFAANVLHPLCAAIEKGQGADDVAAFQGCLVVQLIVDLQQAFGAQAAAQVLQVANGVVVQTGVH